MLEMEQTPLNATLDIPARPMVGTIPTGRINAITRPLPSKGKELILFDRGLRAFASRITKCVARALPLEVAKAIPASTGGERLDLQPVLAKITERVRSDASVTLNFYDLVDAYARSGEPERAPHYFVEPEYVPLSSALRESLRPLPSRTNTGM